MKFKNGGHFIRSEISKTERIGFSEFRTESFERMGRMVLGSNRSNVLTVN